MSGPFLVSHNIYKIMSGKSYYNKLLFLLQRRKNMLRYFDIYRQIIVITKRKMEEWWTF